MEPIERVLASSHQGRFLVADQRPASPRPKKKRKRTEEPDQEAEFWAVKRIVGEKRRDGKRYYLIDWEDHPRTGETFKNSWEPAENVTKDAIDDWKLTKEKREEKDERRRKGDRAKSLASKTPTSSIDSDSQPIRSANQPRAALQTDKNQDQRPSKKHRRAGTVNTARFQSASQESQVLGNDLEIKDTYEDEEESISERVRVVVELPHLGISFDRDAYSKFSLESSQLSQPAPSSQLPVNTLVKSATSRKTFRKPFIWDEDTQVVIPDSQDLLGSLSYEPTRTSSSLEVGTAAESSSVARIESDPLPSRSSQSVPSAQIRHSEPPYHSSFVASLETSLDTFTLENRRGSSLGIPSGHHSPRVSQHVRIQQAQHSPSRQSDRVIGETQSVVSADISSSHSPALHASDSKFPRQHHKTPDQVSPASNTLDSDSHSEPQLSLTHLDGDLPQSVANSVIPQHDTGTSQHAFIEVPDSQTIGLEPSHSTLIVQTEQSNSQFEATWQAAQVVSYTASSFSESLSVQPVEGLGFTQEPSSRPPPTRSQLSPLHSSPTSQAEHQNYSSQNILPSIEPIEETILPGSVVQQLPKYPPPTTKTMENMSVTHLLLQARAKAVAAQAERRASSVYTPTPPPASPGPAALNQMLPSREEVVDRSLLISQPAPSPQPSIEMETGDVEFLDDELVVEHASQILSLGPNEYIVPLPMVGIVRSVIIADIKNNNRKIRRFLNESPIEQDLVEEMKSLIHRMKLCCNHQWLVEEDSATQEQMSDSWVAKFSTNCSTKCIFVVDLLSELRSSDAHIAILVQPGKMMQIMESILRHREFRFKSLDQPGASNAGTSSLKISLVPTDLDITKVAVPSANLIIAFDSSFDREKPLRALRAGFSDTLAPLLHLTVSNSAEHLELCIEKSLKQMDHLISLVILTKQLEHKAGILPVEYLGPDKAGKAVAEYLLANGKQPWPLLPLPYIEELVDFEFESSQEELDVKASEISGSTTQTQATCSQAGSPKPGFKRPMWPEDNAEFIKRPRLSPADGEQCNNTEAGGPRISTPSNRISITEMNNDVEDKDLLTSLMKKVTQIELELQRKEASEQAWQEEKRQLEAQVADFEASNQRILPRYQEALNDRGEAQHSLKLALERENIIKQKADRLSEDQAKLRDAKALVDSKLVNVTAALVNSSIPAVAEMEKLKADLIAAKQENAALQRRLENTQGTVNYIQQNYQTASNAATAAALEVTQLQEQIGKIQIYANNNILEIHKINTTSSLREQLNRIDELTTQKAEVEVQLERKSEELKSMLNGRRPTRGTSVPRSPRMNNTMSPRNRVLGSSSRGNSPAPGDVFGSNRQSFGDALLFPPGGAPMTGRWGQHLS